MFMCACVWAEVCVCYVWECVCMHIYVCACPCMSEYVCMCMCACLYVAHIHGSTCTWRPMVSLWSLLWESSNFVVVVVILALGIFVWGLGFWDRASLCSLASLQTYCAKLTLYIDPGKPAQVFMRARQAPFSAPFLSFLSRPCLLLQ